VTAHFVPLTAREQEVVDLYVGTDLRLDEIAARFRLTEAAVRSRICRACEKLQVHGRDELRAAFELAGIG
jgi:DNA-directed RNA polymerase specialized sigma24 family protein